MDSPRWEQIQALFHQAADLPRSEQISFVRNACGRDDGLAADVLALLEEDAQGGSLLEHELPEVAEQVLGDAALPPRVSRELGHYRIREILGEGGMGVVYLAERKDLRSLVAIKVLRDAWISPARRERFLIEQRTLAQLNHPAIARLYDADTLPDGTPWFVMEYVEGAALNAYSRDHKLAILERLKLFRAVCEAVQYAHQQAVIHRDLKPSNIFVKRDGSVRLLDFGIAKQIESFEAPGDQTRTGLRLMTPAYAAPEQIRGERVGVQADVYSLGVVLYELLTGRLPIDVANLTPAQTEVRLLDQRPDRPSAVASRADVKPGTGLGYAPIGRAAWADLDVLCLTAMHRDAGRRYPSVEALIRDVDHYLKGEPLEARPDSVRYRLGKFVARNRRAVLGLAAAFAIVVGLVAFYTLRLAAARNAALAETARTERIQRFMVDLFQGGDEAAGPADTLRVVTLLDRGVQQAQSLAGEPEVQADLYQNLGSIYQQLGKLNQADSLLQSALDAHRKLFGPDSREVAENLSALGLLRADQARLEEAERLTREGLAMDRRHLPPNHPSVAKASFAVGKVLEDRGNYDDAITVLKQAAQLQSSAGPPTTDLAATLAELANSYFYKGDYAQSETLNQRLLALHRELYGERHPLVADTLLNLASIEYQRGQYREDERYSRQALDITEAWYGKDHPETADTMTILAQALTGQQRYDEARDLLQRSLAILEHAYGPVHPRVAFALNELGNAEIRQGKLDDAEAAFTRAINIYRSVYGDSHFTLSISQSNLAGVYVKRKEYARAEPLFREALARYARSLPDTHPNVAIAHIRLGNALLGERRYADALAETRAGYDALAKKVDPAMSWLKMAREDLAAEYAALKQPENAARFRPELAEKQVHTP
jgi:serine/threonine protein kinase